MIFNKWYYKNNWSYYSENIKKIKIIKSKYKLYLFNFDFRYSTFAKMVDTDTGNLFIVGSFNKRTDPDFKVSTYINHIYVLIKIIIEHHKCGHIVNLDLLDRFYFLTYK